MKQLQQFSFILLLCSILVAHSITSQAQQATGNISGTITTADNHPAEGVTISIQPTDRSAVADNNGRFELSGLNAGTYTLFITLIGHQDVSQTVTVTSGQTSNVNFTLTL